MTDARDWITPPPKKKPPGFVKIFGGLMAVVILTIVIAGLTSQSNPQPTEPGASPAPAPAAVSSTASQPDDPEVTACFARDAAYGDLLERDTASDGMPSAMRMGGGWVWDHADNQCLSGVEYAIAVGPGGGCTEVALDSDNPGYDVEADTPAPLHNVIARSAAC